MKDSIPIVCLFTAACLPLVAQNPDPIAIGFKNYPIDNTGYSALFPADPGKPEISLSDNELKVYTSEVSYNECLYGLQMVLLEDNFINSDKEVLEGLLTSYMEFLKLSFDITSSIGYIKEQKHPENAGATGVMDFWEDERGAQWAVKGWIDKDALVVLYVHGKNTNSMTVPHEFLDGFVFKQRQMLKNSTTEKKLK